MAANFYDLVIAQILCRGEITNNVDVVPLCSDLDRSANFSIMELHFTAKIKTRTAGCRGKLWNTDNLESRFTVDVAFRAEVLDHINVAVLSGNLQRRPSVLEHMHVRGKCV